MRPDRIIVGEVRGGEALDMVQSMISGHAGSLTTVHATYAARCAGAAGDAVADVGRRDCRCTWRGRRSASAIHLIVQLSRFTEDGSRKITRITEQLGLDDENRYQFRDLFTSRIKGRTETGRLVAALDPTQERPSFAGEPRVACAAGDGAAHVRGMWE